MEEIKVFQIGRRMHYAVPIIFNKNGILSQLVTDYVLPNDANLIRRVIHSMLSKVIGKKTLQRSIRLNTKQVSLVYDFALFEYILRKSLLWRLDRSMVFVVVNKLFCYRSISRVSPKLIYAFNTAALEIFKMSKDNTVKILEQCILPKKLEIQLLADSCSDFLPRNYPTLGDKILAAREYEELILADWIIAPSSFVLEGIVSLGIERKKLVLIPYGVELKGRYELHSLGPRKRMKVLFAGEVGFRKGAHLLINTARRMPHIDFIFAGSVTLPKHLVSNLPSNIALLGHIMFNDLSKLYRSCTLFVLPTLVEGSATVTYEALNYGLPVLTTPNAGSLVRDGLDGIIMKANCEDSIYIELNQMVMTPTKIEEYSANILERLDHLGLERYERDLMNFYKTTLHE